MSRMLSKVSLLGALCCMVLIPDLLEATSLVKVKDAQEKAAMGSVSIDSARAHDFLSQSRPRRNVDDKWHRSTPDFQSYYRFYNSIGHIEGLYEIDRLRILYQQMRHLEQVHGADAPTYQNLLGVQTTVAPPTTTTTTTLPPTTTEPPPPPTTQDPLKDAEVFYLCNPRDALCKPQIVFLPTGAVPVLCDPRYNAACRPKSKEEIAAAAPPPPPPPPPPPKKSAPPPPPPPPPAVAAKSMEYDCDPYWDPDCLVDHPPRPAQAADPSPPPPPPPPAAVVVAAPVKEKVEEKPKEAKELQPQFDPYDYKRDLYDPYRYINTAADEE